MAVAEELDIRLVVATMRHQQEAQAAAAPTQIIMGPLAQLAKETLVVLATTHRVTDILLAVAGVLGVLAQVGHLKKVAMVGLEYFIQ
jgi:hypothetical protein